MNEPATQATDSNRTQLPRPCFLPGVALVPFGEPVQPGDVRFVVLPVGEHEPQGLDDDVLPLLVLPEDGERPPDRDVSRVFVAVEGSDTKMVGTITGLLDPGNVGIALVHVTWIPGIAGASIGEGGLDNPSASDLLAYEGAREALVGTADALSAAGFTVSTHLREDRDPAGPLADLVERHDADLFVLGLGRHGAGIGRRLLERVRVPVLYVRAR